MADIDFTSDVGGSEGVSEPTETLDISESTGVTNDPDFVSGDEPTTEDNPEEIVEPVEKDLDAPEGETVEEKVERELLKLKVDGQEIDYDISNREQLIKDLQQSYSAQARFTKAAEVLREMETVKSQFQAFGEQLKTNPMEIIQKMGLDPRQIAEEYLLPIYERMDMPEHERIALEQKEELEKMQKELALHRQKEQQRQQEEITSQRAAQYKAQIGKFIKDNNLPDTEDTLYYIATAYNRALSRNPNTKLQDILPTVKASMQQNISSYISGLDEEGLIEALGKESAEKIRRFYAQKTKASQSKFKGNRSNQRSSVRNTQTDDSSIKGDAETLRELGLA